MSSRDLSQQSAHLGPKPVGYPRGLAREVVPVSVLREAFASTTDLTIKELARRLGLHPSGVGRVVRGHKASQYQNGKRYQARDLSLARVRAVAYLRAMNLRPEDWIDSEDNHA